MATEQGRAEEYAGVSGQAKVLFHDLADEIKEELRDIRTGEQPVEPRADLIMRKHLTGLIILLFALTAIILLTGMIVIYLFNIH